MQSSFSQQDIDLCQNCRHKDFENLIAKVFSSAECSMYCKSAAKGRGVSHKSKSIEQIHTLQVIPYVRMLFLYTFDSPSSSFRYVGYDSTWEIWFFAALE